MNKFNENMISIYPSEYICNHFYSPSSGFKNLIGFCVCQLLLQTILAVFPMRSGFILRFIVLLDLDYIKNKYDFGYLIRTEVSLMNSKMNLM